LKPNNATGREVASPSTQASKKVPFSGTCEAQLREEFWRRLEKKLVEQLMAAALAVSHAKSTTLFIDMN
jgi:hypothetical protein